VKNLPFASNILKVYEYVYCPVPVVRQTLFTDVSELMISLTILVRRKFVSHRCMPLD